VRWTSSSIALSATLLFLAPVAQAQTPLAPGELARVGDKPVLKTEYDHWVRIARHSLADEADPVDHAEVRDQVMQTLISFRWIEGEASLRKITVSTRRVNAEFRKQKRESFKNENEYRKFLRDSGQTTADVLVRVRQDLLTQRIRAQVVRGAKTTQGQNLRIERFLADFPGRWIDVTVCGDGYDTDDCGSVVPLST
jgi:hypothetical protein